MNQTRGLSLLATSPLAAGVLAAVLPEVLPVLVAALDEEEPPQAAMDSAIDIAKAMAIAFFMCVSS